MNEKNPNKKIQTIDVTEVDHEGEFVPVNFSKDIGGKAVQGAEGNPWHELEDDTTDTADFPDPNTPESAEVIKPKEQTDEVTGKENTPFDEEDAPLDDSTVGAIVNPNLSPREAEAMNPDGTQDF